MKGLGRSSASLSPVGRFISVATVSGLLFVLVSTVIGIRMTLGEIDRLHAENRENAIWLISQVELEHKSYLAEVLSTLRAGILDAQSAGARVRESFDIYYSRVETARAFLDESKLNSPQKVRILDSLNEVTTYRDELAKRIDAREVLDRPFLLALLE